MKSMTLDSGPLELEIAKYFESDLRFISLVKWDKFKIANTMLSLDCSG